MDEAKNMKGTSQELINDKIKFLVYNIQYYNVNLE